MTSRQSSSASPGPGPDQLWREFTHGRSRRARNRLVLAFVPLVREIASRSRRGLPSSVDVADLESDGYIGLMDAVEKFDPYRGREFRSYAAPRIRGAIVDGLRATDWVPRFVRLKIRALSTAATELEQRHGHPPSEAEMATELGISRPRLRIVRAQTSYARLVGLDAGTRGDGREPPADEVGDARSEVVRDAVRDLPDREQWVISLSYWGRLTLKEIGQILGLSESRVSQLRGQARAALRITLKKSVTKPQVSGRRSR